MLTWTSECARPLAGCGVDIETVARFGKLAGEAEPWPIAFSAREAAHAAGLPDPAAGFCAAFGCKEAAFKAIRRPFRFPDCELLYDPAAEGDQPLLLSPDLRREFGLSGGVARIIRLEPGQLVSVVHLFGGPG